MLPIADGVPADTCPIADCRGGRPCLVNVPPPHYPYLNDYLDPNSGNTFISVGQSAANCVYHAYFGPSLHNSSLCNVNNLAIDEVSLISKVYTGHTTVPIWEDFIGPDGLSFSFSLLTAHADVPGKDIATSFKSPPPYFDPARPWTKEDLGCGQSSDPVFGYWVPQPGGGISYADLRVVVNYHY
jgi:hypothetical protein